MKAIIYTRVSTEEQTTNFSLPHQEKACIEYAKGKGWEIDRVFKEEGESGTWFNRTQLQNLLEYCRKTKKEEKVLVVYSIDRLARDVEVHYAIKALLNKYKVPLFSVNQPIDSSAEGQLMETIFAGTSQYENKLRGRRAKDGLRKRFESGYWCWGAPFGYKNIKTADGQKIVVPDPETAPHITFAFNEYAKGIYSKVQIARKLRRRGLKTKTGKKVWPQFIDKILRNKFHAGIMVSEKWNEERQGVHQPLIDMETFTKVQLILQGKSVAAIPRTKCRPEYPLRSFIKCPVCLNPLTASQSIGHGGKYHYYHCYSKPRHGSSYPKEKVETEFKGYLGTIIPNESRLKLFKEVVVDVWETKKKEAGIDIKRTEAKIAKLEEDRGKTIDLLRKGTLTEEEGRLELNRIRKELEFANLEKSEIENDKFNVRTAVDKCVEALKNSHKFWLNLESVEQKQRFQKLIFPDGAIYENPGFRTTQMGLLFQLIPNTGGEKTSLVRPGGFEPPTNCLRGNCSTTELRSLFY